MGVCGNVLVEDRFDCSISLMLISVEDIGFTGMFIFDD